MPYIGKSTTIGVRQRYMYTATASQTTFSGTDTQNLTLTYTDSNFVDVYLNGVLLKTGTDYTATSGTSVVLASGAVADDIVEIIVYDTFAVANFYNRTDSDSRYVNIDGDTMTGALAGTTGGSASPSFTFSGDTDTGIFRTAANTIGFTAGGTETVQIGSFGVAADTLTNKTASGGITIDAAGDITLDADGGDVIFKDGGSEKGRFTNNSGTFTIDANTNLTFRGGVQTFDNADGSTEYMRLNSDGDLLLGSSTDAGYGPLQIGSTSTASTIAQFLSATDGVNTIHFGDATSGTARYRGYIQYNHNGDKLTFGTSASDTVIIDSSGRVTISQVGTDTTISGGQPGLQVTGSAFDGFLSAVRRDNGAFGSGLMLAKSRNTTADNFTIVQDSDTLGSILFIGDDGTDLDTYGALIFAKVNGTPAANDMPTDLIFSTNGGSASPTERMRILSGGGLTFNGDTATANALDDYEEGTYTPSLSISGSTSGISINASNGTYTKIGRLVVVTLRINLDNKGSNSGRITATLPFGCQNASVQHGAAAVYYLFNFSSLTDGNVGFAPETNLAQGALFHTSSGSDLTADTNINNNSQFAVTISYVTN